MLVERLKIGLRGLQYSLLNTPKQKQSHQKTLRPFKNKYIYSNTQNIYTIIDICRHITHVMAWYICENIKATFSKSPIFKIKTTFSKRSFCKSTIRYIFT